ncbi:lipopolysaccharide biosynthesis protein [Aurantiacibacter gangjinensis]|uniref:Capsule biosynthesis protein CapK n=1 Tax=Aurantiacibacter gangjinensis TaxID=502682 RepID=A0A0G9MMG0_9SPHN|nr:lipopolysaccharide biosynthesis protein [Aurantiacibacter gangjinensis]APE27933.1 Lipopolysaccharide biosynthesis protein WzxC [Aurantiacibacter gangjinensis]KLE31882.1 capsule biosynthesis protein CapK [Aurantiacibacter gangjinensis]
MTASMRDSVKRAVMWRSGSQVAAQVVAWGSTLIVIRILDPADYGLFAMTQVVMVFLSFLGGFGFASSLIQDRELTEQKIRQAFGLLLLINGGLALAQVLLAPLAAAYYRTPDVTALLRVQALIYLATPFIALPEVLLTREMDFRRPAIANITATFVSAGVALFCALSDFGVWTLIFAPIAAFWTRAAALMIAARFAYLPSFRLKGARKMFDFGILLLAGHFFWVVLTQADIFIAGRALELAQVGFYAEAMFLTGIIAHKLVPALNEVAFPAYSQLQDDLPALRFSFLKAVRLVMLAVCPIYFGLAVTSTEAVHLLLGEKWLPLAPIVTVLALAMPAVTLHTMFAPAVNALGHPRISMFASLCGAAVMPLAFLLAVPFGPIGLAWVWVAAFPLVPLTAFLLSRRLLGIGAADLLRAVAPALGASAAMALPVMALGEALGHWPGVLRLAAMVSAGAAIYGGLLYLFARATLLDVVDLLFRRKAPVVQPAE